MIDARQSDPQANVIQALRGMGHTDQADHYTHFSYEMVALTPRCAEELGYSVSDEDKKKAYIEVSGRKGFGVKADDLIDKLIAATRAEVDARQTGGADESRAPEDRRADRHRRAALLHAQVHAQLRHRLRLQRRAQLRGRDRPLHSIRRRAHPQHLPQRRNDAGSGVSGVRGVSGRCDRTLSSGRRQRRHLGALAARRPSSLVLEQCIATSEPAYLAKHAFQLAQEFANFYHRHHILTEEDPARKTFLLATAAVTLRELVASLALLGIESPEAM